MSYDGLNTEAYHSDLVQTPADDMNRHDLAMNSLQMRVEDDPMKNDSSNMGSSKQIDVARLNDQIVEPRDCKDQAADDHSPNCHSLASRTAEPAASGDIGTAITSPTYTDIYQSYVAPSRHPLSTATIDGRFPPRVDSFDPTLPWISPDLPRTPNPRANDKSDMLLGLHTTYSRPFEKVKQYTPRTVFTDPRARTLPFMQASSDGWTPHLDDYVHARSNSQQKTDMQQEARPLVEPKLGNLYPERERNVPQCRFDVNRPSFPQPHCRDAAPNQHERYKFNHSRSHSEVSPKDLSLSHGQERLRRTFQQQMKKTQAQHDKILPSPPLAALTPVARARLGLEYSETPHITLRRVGSAPSVPSPRVVQLTTVAPRGVNAYQINAEAIELSPEALRRTGSPIRRGHTHDVTPSRPHPGTTQPRLLASSPFSAQESLREPCDRQSSRLDHLCKELSHSPERTRSKFSSSPTWGGRSPTRHDPSPGKAERQAKADGSPDGHVEDRLWFRSSTEPELLLNDQPQHHHSQRDVVEPICAEHNVPGTRVTQWPVIPQGNLDKLWGAKGVLDRPEGSEPRRARSPSRGMKQRAATLKTMAERLMHNINRPGSNNAVNQAALVTQSSLHASAAGSSVVASTTAASTAKPPASPLGFPISLTRAEQMRLYGEVEYLLQTLANDFLLEQLAAHRLSADSVKSVARTWAHRGRAQVVGMSFDLRTQLELVQRNLMRVHFHGAQTDGAHRRLGLMYAWKDVARELGVRSFCAADSAVKKMLSDCYVMLDMLGAPGAHWLVFQKLHVEALDKMKRAELERNTRQQRAALQGGKR